MKTNPVKPDDLSSYLGKDVGSIDNNKLLFEALAETIADKNKNYEMDRFAEQYKESSEEDPWKFTEEKFDEVVHNDTYDVISYAHRNNWIEYTVRGLVEYGVADPECLD